MYCQEVYAFFGVLNIYLLNTSGNFGKKIKTMLVCNSVTFAFLLFVTQVAATSNTLSENELHIIECIVNNDGNACEKLENINTKDSSGSTLLHWAVLNKNEQAVINLVNSGANVNIQNNDLKSPLHLAAENNDIEIEKILLEKGANVNLRDINKNTPLFAALNGVNMQVRTLLAKEESQKAHGINETTMLENLDTYHYMRDRGLEELGLLVKYGAEINTRNKDYQSPLHLAAMSSYPEFVEFLIEYGAEVNVQDKDGRTPLHLAIIHIKNIGTD